MTDDVLLTPKQLAKRWSMQPNALARRRSKHQGPTYIRVGPSPRAPVRYRLADVLAYEKTTQEPGHADSDSQN